MHYLRFSDFSDEFKSFFYTLFTHVATGFYKAVVSLGVVSQDIEGFFTGNGDQIASIRPKDLVKT
jgi:hypothetical protein